MEAAGEMDASDIEPFYGIQSAEGRFAKRMIRSKFARLGRVAALVAGLASVAGSFGLHPEPVADSPAPAQTEWAAPGGDTDATPHICLACLAHRSVPLPRLASVVLPPQPVVSAAARVAAASVVRFDSPSPDGRAPPVLG
jgi:hypothetical protein